MTFATLAALAAPPVSVKMMLHARLAGYEEPRPHFPLRASDLLSSRGEFCPREHAFMDMGLAKKQAEFIGTALRMTFNHGRFMEEKIRNDYLADLVVGSGSARSATICTRLSASARRPSAPSAPHGNAGFTKSRASPTR